MRESTPLILNHLDNVACSPAEIVPEKYEHLMQLGVEDPDDNVRPIRCRLSLLEH